MLLELPPQWLAEIAEAVTRQIDEQERWVTLEGLAAWLGCEPSHVYDLRQRGLPAHRLTKDGRPSKKFYFSLRDVGTWFDQESIAA